MTPIEFESEIKILKSGYLNWQFDISDKQMVLLWYSIFKNISHEEMLYLIKKYIGSNKYPPNSPFELKQAITSDIESNMPSAYDTRMKLESIAKTCGICWKNKWDVKVRDRLKSDPTLLYIFNETCYLMNNFLYDGSDEAKYIQTFNRLYEQTKEKELVRLVAKYFDDKDKGNRLMLIGAIPDELEG